MFMSGQSMIAAFLVMSAGAAPMAFAIFWASVIFDAAGAAAFFSAGAAGAAGFWIASRVTGATNASAIARRVAVRTITTSREKGTEEDAPPHTGSMSRIGGLGELPR